MVIEIIDKRLLNLVQREFPLDRYPYDVLGRALGVDGELVIRQLKSLKSQGIIRQISPVIDARRIGYQPTLVAAHVNQDEVERAEESIIRHPGVSHGYERDHYYNIWFTLSVAQGLSMDGELARLTASFAAQEIFALPSIKVFKIGAYFDMEGPEQVSTPKAASNNDLPGKVVLTAEDKSVISELQNDLPLVHAPFDNMAARLNIDVDRYLDRCRSLLTQGIIRRFGASINHTRAGFSANGMACWVVPEGKVECAGRKLASLPQVSHCYERVTNQRWPYNVFAMIHSKTREQCREIARGVTSELDLSENVVLFSTREFKKTRVRYLP
jgi:siroheme decarboxylase